MVVQALALAQVRPAWTGGEEGLSSTTRLHRQLVPIMRIYRPGQAALHDTYQYPSITNLPDGSNTNPSAPAPPPTSRDMLGNIFKFETRALIKNMPISRQNPDAPGRIRTCDHRIRRTRTTTALQ